MRERREDVERLLGLLDLLLLGKRVEGAHVVEAIGELDQDDPDVRGHRDHHLPVVLGLLLVAALERDACELRDAVDELADLLAECGLDVLERRARVLDRVVEQRRADRLGVEAHARADLCDADGVGDEVLAGLALLIGVALAGEAERFCDPRLVDRLEGVVGVLLDQGEQIDEQLALLRGETLGELGVGDALRALLVHHADANMGVGKTRAVVGAVGGYAAC